MRKYGRVNLWVDAAVVFLLEALYKGNSVISGTPYPVIIHSALRRYGEYECITDQMLPDSGQVS